MPPTPRSASAAKNFTLASGSSGFTRPVGWTWKDDNGDDDVELNGGWSWQQQQQQQQQQEEEQEQEEQQKDGVETLDNYVCLEYKKLEMTYKWWIWEENKKSWELAWRVCFQPVDLAHTIVNSKKHSWWISYHGSFSIWNILQTLTSHKEKKMHFIKGQLFHTFSILFCILYYFSILFVPLESTFIRRKIHLPIFRQITCTHSRSTVAAPMASPILMASPAVTAFDRCLFWQDVFWINVKNHLKRCKPFWKNLNPSWFFHGLKKLPSRDPGDLCSARRWWWAGARGPGGTSPAASPLRSPRRSRRRPKSWGQTPRVGGETAVVEPEMVGFSERNWEKQSS